jgi:hypothetical protein
VGLDLAVPRRDLEDGRLMRRARYAAACALAAATVLGGATMAAADPSDPGPFASATDSPSPGAGDAGPTEAGTSFRTAQNFLPGQQATADASSGDYLYWSVPLDAGQRATVDATVTFPDSSVRHASTTWEVDVYDGLRRRQSCMYGTSTRQLAADATTVHLSCTLRTVRAWAEPWANDPLPGAYYIRLTAVQAGQTDLGLPMQAAVDVTTKDEGGAAAVGGKLAAPLTPPTAAAPAPAATPDDSTSDDSTDATPSPDGSPDDTVAAVEPDGGWSSGWWTDRWLWTGGGAVGAALAGIAGYVLTRPRHHLRPRGRHMPPPGAGY